MQLCAWNVLETPPCFSIQGSIRDVIWLLNRKLFNPTKNQVHIIFFSTFARSFIRLWFANQIPSSLFAITCRINSLTIETFICRCYVQLGYAAGIHSYIACGSEDFRCNAAGLSLSAACGLAILKSKPCKWWHRTSRRAVCNADILSFIHYFSSPNGNQVQWEAEKVIPLGQTLIFFTLLPSCNNGL